MSQLLHINGQLVNAELSCGDDNGNWRVILWTSPRVTPIGWSIVNIKTGRTKYIGRLGAKRTNYYDVAKNEVARRNALEATK